MADFNISQSSNFTILKKKVFVTSPMIVTQMKPQLRTKIVLIYCLIGLIAHLRCSDK